MSKKNSYITGAPRVAALVVSTAIRLVLAGGLVVALVLLGRDALSESFELPGKSPSSSVPVQLSTGTDYTRHLGKAVVDKRFESLAPGQIEYCPLDSAERATCAAGLLDAETRSAAKITEREPITVDPAGWPIHNNELTISALDLEGSKDYTGWFWNRSHLIADSLGGNASAQNLVTGTRTQNVGSTQTSGQHSGGMAYPELIARTYLDSNDAASCPLYYAATPVYTDAELIPRTVVVDLKNCNGDIDMRIEVLNSANGYSINYTTAEISVADAHSAQADTEHTEQ